jgi:DNA adenine methylase
VRYNATANSTVSGQPRKGTTPTTMREQIFGASILLKGRTSFSSKNYRDALQQVKESDLVYMDPPYQGVCGNRDTRYLASVQFCEFVDVLETLNARNIRYIVSYDGRTGNKVYGARLPEHLNLTHMELDAGRSTQATLLGRDEATSSRFISPPTGPRTAGKKKIYTYTRAEQLCLMEARA